MPVCLGAVAPLRASRRNKLPDSAFAYPRTRKYPIDTLRRARNALARAAQRGTSGSYSHVAKAVRRRYGNKVATVGRARGKVTGPGLRKGKGGGKRRRKPSTRRSRSRSRSR
jgi:hypothetical protein